VKVPHVDAVPSHLLPSHVAVIMDGNGRWAQEKGLPRIEGHRRGADVVRDITTYARELGLQYLTLYSFSCQNWRRSAEEVAGLMALLEDFCRSEYTTLMENGIRLRTIGDLFRLPSSTRMAVQELVDASKRNTDMTLTLALDYGGREEIVKAAQALAVKVLNGQMRVQDITEAALESQLDTAYMPDPALLIRTSGEVRVSNFLLWQISYSELYFSQVRWPDFSRADFAQALKEYAMRERRFGAESVEVAQAC
jgi:undecaprenyl diphosphate synthase